MPGRTAVSHLVKRSHTLTGTKVGIDMGLASVILKHIRYKATSGCIHVSERARIRLQSGKRIYAKQFYWREILGVRASKIDTHMERACAPIEGYKCMNPDHILVKHTRQMLSELLFAFTQCEGDTENKYDMNCAMKNSQDDSGVVSETTLWRNHASATEEVVICESDLPFTVDQVTETPPIVDYFSLLPAQKLISITELRKVNIAS